MAKKLSPSEKLERKLEKRRNQRIGLIIEKMVCIDVVDLDRVKLRCTGGNERIARWKDWHYSRSPTDCGKRECVCNGRSESIGSAIYQKWCKIKKIGVVEEWKDFEVFNRWSLDKYDEFKQIHRLDKSKPFGPNNAKYFTPKEAYWFKLNK